MNKSPIKLKVRVQEFPLPESTRMDATIVIPAVKGTWGLKYGKHAYYFMDFKSLKGFCFEISHLDIIRPGWNKFKHTVAKHNRPASISRCCSSLYHYGFSLLEQVMLMTVPHTATFIGNGRFIINLWSWCGYVLIDTVKKTAEYHILPDRPNDMVLGSQQWFDSQTKSLYAMSYSLNDSIKRIAEPTHPVEFEIFKHKPNSSERETIWRGGLSDYMHDIIVNKTRQYCVACELGMHKDANDNILPSKVLIVDMKNGKHWKLDKFIVAAHACFDPQDPNTVYFSNHNFEFKHSTLWQLIKKGSYAVKFRDPASIYKYELTSDGPHEIGIFTHPDFYRLTNMHAFVHRGCNVIIAMGFPDELFLINADDMTFIKKIFIKDPLSIKHFYSKKKALVGTIAPSPDGEKLFVQTTRSFQVVDINSGDCEYTKDYYFSHICFNHMLATGEE